MFTQARFHVSLEQQEISSKIIVFKQLSNFFFFQFFIVLLFSVKNMLQNTFASKIHQHVQFFPSSLRGMLFFLASFHVRLSVFFMFLHYLGKVRSSFEWIFHVFFVRTVCFSCFFIETHRKGSFEYRYFQLFVFFHTHRFFFQNWGHHSQFFRFFTSPLPKLESPLPIFFVFFTSPLPKLGSPLPIFSFFHNKLLLTTNCPTTN